MKEDVPQFLTADAILRRVKLMLHIADEFLGILGSIVFAVLESAADDVVGNIVGLPQLEALYYPDIHGMPDEFVAVRLVPQGGHGDFLRSEWLAYVEVDVAFLLLDAGKDAVEVFHRPLYVLLPS